VVESKTQTHGSGKGKRSPEDVTLTAAGLTLLGVLLSVGLTVAFGIGGAWWVKVCGGAATSTGLALLAAWTTSTGRGFVARLANWVIGGNR
jgi:hypothetical protein